MLAHSMGNEALTQALQQLTANGLQEPHQVVFAAADVSQSNFRRRMEDAPRGAAPGAQGPHYTLYRSSRDWALWLSKLLRPRGLFDFAPRAGDASEYCLSNEFDTVNCDTVWQNPQDDPRFHSYVFKHPDVAADISLVLRQVCMHCRAQRERCCPCPAQTLDLTSPAVSEHDTREMGNIHPQNAQQRRRLLDALVPPSLSISSRQQLAPNTGVPAATVDVQTAQAAVAAASAPALMKVLRCLKAPWEICWVGMVAHCSCCYRCVAGACSCSCSCCAGSR